MNWLNRLVVCCDCNRPTLDSIKAAGFTLARLEHTALPKAPKFVRPAILGSATEARRCGHGRCEFGPGWVVRDRPSSHRAQGRICLIRNT
jgi:hypothetical protein